MKTLSSIPLQTEVIVSVAFRFRDTAPALHVETRRFPVRTPEELTTAVEEMEAILWGGTLHTIHIAGRR